VTREVTASENPGDLVSIVIPVYNVAHYLDRCVRSCLSQEHKCLQIILVDDGSTDGSGTMCDIWATKDSRIQVIHTVNSGLSGARNAGMHYVLGDYVLFIDSDDAIMPGHVSKLLAAIRSCPEPSTSIAVTGFTAVPVGQSDVKNYESESNTTCYLTVEEAVSESVSYSGRFAAHAWGKLYPKTFFGLLHYPLGKYYEDQYVTPNVFLAASTIAYEDANDYLYTIGRSGSISVGSRMRELDYLEAIRGTVRLASERCSGALAAVTRRYLDSLIYGLETACLNGTTDLIDQLFNEAASMRSIALPNNGLDKNVRMKYRSLAFGKDAFASAVRARFKLKSSSHVLEKMGNRIDKKRRAVQLLGEYSRQAEHTNASIFLVMTPRYRNYGDQLIAFSEHKLMEEAGFQDVIEVPYEDCDVLGRRITKLFGEGDTVLFTGGGYLGDLWPGLENVAEDVLASVGASNKVLFFPESVYYAESELEESSFSRAMSSAKAVATLCVRERVSHDRLSSIMPHDRLLLLPDVGLFIKRSDLMAQVPKREKGLALVCIRHDKESMQDASFGVKLTAALNHMGMSIRSIDTHSADGKIEPEERHLALSSLAEEFGRASVVVTNRLHGMIFAMIMSTPCVVLDNVSRKISGVAEWVKDEYPVVLCDEDDIEEAVIKASRMDPYEGDVADLLEDYQEKMLGLIRKTVTNG
jgi:exopolysaccharide biosynthesis predicted pyruvyltransferase EpsI/glycosyltransferase involved in cell wall biosynthesis